MKDFEKEVERKDENESSQDAAFIGLCIAAALNNINNLWKGQR